MESVKTAKENRFCHDCKKEIKIENKKIKDGLLLEYDNNGERIFVLKCNQCFKKNPHLTNFQRCEVYSRVCGYLRPVGQWNEGKQREFKERKEYKYGEKK